MDINPRRVTRPVWWKRITVRQVVGYAAIIAYAVVMVYGAINFERKAREKAAFNQAASHALYRERCKEIGGVNSETETKLCIVGSRTVDVHEKNYRTNQ